MKLLGHPLHLMLIHFPTALLPMEAVCYALYYLTGETSFATAGFYALAGGIGTGCLALLFGMLDLVAIPASRPVVQKLALWHGGLNLVVLIGFSVFLYRQWQQYPVAEPATLAILLVKAGLLLVLFAGNYLGGSLILKHRVAVLEETSA